MQLQACLTVGWKDSPDATPGACTLDSTAARANDYAEALGAALQSEVHGARILGLHRLFRRRSGGAEPLKRFLGALVSLPPPADVPEPLLCEIDAFAYAFLKGAKNLDLILPPAGAENDGFRDTRRRWSSTVEVLEDFERDGVPLPDNAGVTREAYLAVRRIVTRPSARDERRTLLTLLVSGPSSLTDITEDLGLNYSLGQRTVAGFMATGVVEQRPGEVYAIAEDSLALTVFCLRETMGLNLLPLLAEV